MIELFQLIWPATGGRGVRSLAANLMIILPCEIQKDITVNISATVAVCHKRYVAF